MTPPSLEDARTAQARLGPKGDVQDKRRFVTIWKKVNGEWKVAHDIGVTTTPEAPATE